MVFPARARSAGVTAADRDGQCRAALGRQPAVRRRC